MLLVAPGDGWVDRGALLRHIADFVMPGQAHRTAALKRKTESGPQHMDALRVGSRRVANKILAGAVRSGIWIREGDMVRHRDWQPQAADVPESGTPAFVVPSLDELKRLSEMLTGFTKWHWAAVVACYVEESESKANLSADAKNSMLSTLDFAALGIAGLQSKDTVRRYLHVWLEAHEGQRPEPGQPVAIPDMSTWPTKRIRKRDRAQREVQQVKQPSRRERDPKVIAEWCIANWGADVAAEIARALIRETSAVAQTANAIGENVVPFRREA